MKHYDVIIIGAGPGGIFSAYELTRLCPDLKVALFETGAPLENRRCPIDGDKVKTCIHCKTCSIMNGFGGAGAFSDGKYNITNEFGGTLYEYIGRSKAIDLMNYVDKNYMNNITLNEVASAGGVSRSLCNTIFNKYTQMTPIEYIMHFRTRKVADLLQSGDMPMSEIAEMTGFSNASYMAETFKKFYKFSPREYKKTMQSQ